MADARDVPVSVREVSDITYRILRVGGMSSGCAMRAADMVQHAEVYHGIGLRMLHRRLDLVEDGIETSALEVDRGPADTLTIDAAGMSALVAGPPALDLVRARAAEDRAGTVWLSGVRELSLLDELPYRAAASGFICILSWAIADTAEELGKSRTVVAGPGSEGVVAVERPLAAPSQLLLTVANTATESAGTVPSGGRDLARPGKAQAVINDALTPVDTEGAATVSGAALLCLQASSEDWFEPFLHRLLEQQHLPENQVRTRADLLRQWETTCAHGLSMKTESWREVYEAAGRMLAPETEVEERNLTMKEE